MFNEKKDLKQIFVSGIIAFIVFIFFACSNSEMVQPDGAGAGVGQVKFGLTSTNQSSNISKNITIGSIQKMNSISNAVSILVSIENSQGQVYNLKKLSIFNLGTGFISEPLSLNTGNYKITDYMILDGSDNVIFVTPKTGSEKAYLIQNPLPLDLTIQKNVIVNSAPEIISTDNSTPGEFGYTTFSFNLINTYNFLASAFIVDNNIMQLTTASIMVTNGGASLYNGTLSASTNSITIKDVSSDYVITITKTGYETYVKTFTNSGLKAFISTPLNIILAATSIPRDGLVAEYLFDGNANDTSGNGNNGTVNGATITSDRMGNENKAYLFNNASIKLSFCPLEGGTATPKSFTISAWINSNKMPATNLYGQAIFNQQSSALNSTNLSYTIFNNQFNRMSYGIFHPANNFGLGNTQIQINTWYHVVLVRNNNTWYHFLNGIMESSGTSMLDYSDSSPITESFIGNAATSNTNWNFNGKIDNVRIYNRALTQQEITQLCNEIN